MYTVDRAIGSGGGYEGTDDDPSMGSMVLGVSCF